MSLNEYQEYNNCRTCLSFNAY